MLDVIYNDPFTTLSIIDNMSASYALIVDSTLKTYATIIYNEFDTTSLLAAWVSSVIRNLELKTIDNTSTHREMLASKSITAFKKFLKELDPTSNL